MKVTAIGTSGSFPGPHAASSCYLLEVPAADRTWRIVVDLGSGAVGPLQRVVSTRDIDAVILSHLHPDHCLDVTALYVMRAYDPEYFLAGKRLPKIPIYGPAGTHARLQAAHHTEPGLADTGDTPSDISAAFDFIDLTPDSTHQIGPLSVQAFLVEHPVEAYALRFTAPNGAVFTYSGDTDACENLIRAARGSDLFLCESAFDDQRDPTRGIHLTGSRAGAVAAEAGVGRLVLTHIPPWTDTDSVLAAATEAYGAVVGAAQPLNSWTVIPKRTT